MLCHARPLTYWRRITYGDRIGFMKCKVFRRYAVEWEIKACPRGLRLAPRLLGAVTVRATVLFRPTGFYSTLFWKMISCATGNGIAAKDNLRQIPQNTKALPVEVDPTSWSREQMPSRAWLRAWDFSVPFRLVRHMKCQVRTHPLLAVGSFPFEDVLPVKHDQNSCWRSIADAYPQRYRLRRKSLNDYSRYYMLASW